MGSYAIMTNPSYDNAKWRFTYSSLYPVEYTKILAATVKHNLKFANQGQSDRTYIEQSVLSMGFFQWINQFNLDKQRFNERLLEKVRKQTQFNPGYVAIVMTGNDKKFKTNYVDSFTSVIYDLQADKEIPGATAYLLPGGRVIAKSEKMLILPVTPLRLFSDKSGYALGIKLDINYDPEDDFDAIGTANMLKNMYQTAVNSCIDGEATPKGELNGLSSYFNQSETDFEGFFMEPGIVLDESGQKQANFLKSIRTAFQKYWAYSAKYGNKTPSEDTCLEALKGISMVVSTGALINQYYLPSLINHVE